MNLFSILSLAATLLGLIAFTQAQQLDPLKNFCRRLDHQSTVKDKTLYIHGGVEIFTNIDGTGKQAGPKSIGINTYLIFVDLSGVWDWKTNLSLTSFNEREESENVTSNNGPGVPAPNVIRGALYQGTPNDPNIYLFGGTTSFEGNGTVYSNSTILPGFGNPPTEPNSLYSYNPALKAWNRTDVSAQSPIRPNSGAYAEAPDQGLAFWFNGEIDSGSSPSTQALGDAFVAVLGMLVMEMGNGLKVTNVSTQGVSGGKPVVRGKMVYVPGFGKNGVLLHIGGSAKATTDVSDTPGEMVGMDVVDILDISQAPANPEKAWYKQSTVGDFPSPRMDHCLVLASAQDNSSHNIYMYGGRDNKGQFFSDVHVLSLPSFTWTQVSTGYGGPRYGHACHVVAQRQLLSYGGADSENLTDTCDYEYRAVGLFDM
ncbi:MAG: hypothetical protein M1839_003196 [Geoglossum umbratile]|nr:MAG: hypothetical protein M1839_003196 [Geoglossum umbratile]